MQVDAEHKAVQFVILDNSNPHSRAFHVSWWGFFSSFFSMFAGARRPSAEHARPYTTLLARHRSAAHAQRERSLSLAANPPHVPRHSCAADGVHEEGDLPQPEQE